MKTITILRIKAMVLLNVKFLVFNFLIDNLEFL